MTLRDLAHARRSDYLDMLKTLAATESPTSDKAANDHMADRLERLLSKDGWTLQRIQKEVVGDQLVARWLAPGELRTLILCHFDTVWPLGTLEAMPLKEDGDKFYGPGTLDMKAGITTALQALRLVKAQNLRLRGPVTLLLTSDEEKGSLYSRDLIERLARSHDRVLVLEPGREDGAIKVGRKGTGEFSIRFSGVSAHAGNNPSDGASALRELAHFLHFAENLTNTDKGTTVNLTVARGGSTTNVIAEKAEAFIDMRALHRTEAERVTQALRTYSARDARVSLEVKGGLNRPPMEMTEANRALFDEAARRAAPLGIGLEPAVVGGGSDGNFSSALGVATLDGLGAVGEGPHARHEHIRISETLDRLALICALLTEASNEPDGV